MSGEFGPVVFRQDSELPHTPLGPVRDDWGIRACDLVGPPRRFWADGAPAPPTVELAVDLRRLRQAATPAGLLGRSIGSEQTWSAQSQLSLGRLRALFLVCEDPQRRLDVRAVSTLAHQVSLVRHVLDDVRLRRVLIADEVGLGKTVETGLIIGELIETNPGLRVLYLAPARLVRNVRREFDRLKLGFRQWTSVDRDATLQDNRVVASIHKATHGGNQDQVIESGPWNVLVVDECHHLSDWEPGGGDPKENYRLVSQLISRMPEDGRVIFLSGTPHQGHAARFENVLRLLRTPTEDEPAIAGRVIYRTKDDVRDWDGNPLFPTRQVNEPILFEPGPEYREWIQTIYEFYHPGTGLEESRKRAAGWRCAQALQWAASSPQAGLGYLVRQAIRSGWNLQTANLRSALAALRPYRRGPVDEPIDELYGRILKDIDVQVESDEVEDIEDMDSRETRLAQADIDDLADLLGQGLNVLRIAADKKWDLLRSTVLDRSGEKIVLFAQPIETVMALAQFLERQYGQRPALIVGGQSDSERQAQIDAFSSLSGPRFLVSSKAGGEGINLQIARRLVHIDVPWNPMDLEQRVGRVHRFGSRQTIIVDTFVASGSREEEAYRVARQKLKLIVETMVEPERFEAVFGRVMALVGQEEMQDLMLSGPGAPMGEDEQDRLGHLVRQGFNQWKSFHDLYSGQQRKIRALSPGLADWSDVEALLRDVVRARSAEGFVAQRFALRNGTVDPIPEPASVVTMNDKDFFACGDYSGAPVFGPLGELAQSIGLNTPTVTDALRRLAFPSVPVGAAHLRWSGGQLPIETPFPFGVLVLLRQSLRSEQGSWTEIGSELRCFVTPPSRDPVEVVGHRRAAMVRGLLSATVRVKPEGASDLVAEMMREESRLIDELRRTTADDGERRIRHAVAPVFAAIVSGPA